MPCVLVARSRTPLSKPIRAGIGRELETRADMDAWAATGDRNGCVEMQRALALRADLRPHATGLVTMVVGEPPHDAERVAG